MGDEQQEHTGAGDRWGDPISDARKEELRRLFKQQKTWSAISEAERGEQASHFHGVHLTGADVAWLAEQSGRNAWGLVLNLHLETLYVNRGLLCYKSRTEGGHLEVPGQRSAEDMFL
jgi:hypothetical protein